MRRTFSLGISAQTRARGRETALQSPPSADPGETRRRKSSGALLGSTRRVARKPGIPILAAAAWERTVCLKAKMPNVRAKLVLPPARVHCLMVCVVHVFDVYLKGSISTTTDQSARASWWPARTRSCKCGARTRSSGSSCSCWSSLPCVSTRKRPQCWS